MISVSASTCCAIFVLGVALNLGSVASAESNSTSGMIDYSDYLTPQASFDWMLQCQGCHGPNGEGLAKRDVPKLQNEVSKFLLVEGGREFIVRVPGVSGSPLSDDRLAELLNWMFVSLDPDHLNNEWKIFTADEVHSLRRKPLRTEIEHSRTVIMTNIKNHFANSQTISVNE